MIEEILQVASVLGGLSAIGYFVDKFNQRRIALPASAAAMKSIRKVRKPFGLRILPIPLPLILTAQWMVAAYFITMTSFTAGARALVLPYWAIPIGYCVARYLTHDAVLTRLAGGFVGGVVGATVGSLFAEWATTEGMVVGMFFCSQLAGYFSEPKRHTTALSALLGMFVLLGGLGVLTGFRFYAKISGESFAVSTVALLLACLCAMLIRAFATKKPKKSLQKQAAVS